MEFRAESNTGLDSNTVGCESHLSQLHTQFVLAWILSLVLILHIGMDITKEQLFVLWVSEHESYTLVGNLTSCNQLVISINESLQHFLVMNHHLHLEGVVRCKYIFETLPLVSLCIEVQSTHNVGE